MHNEDLNEIEELKGSYATGPFTEGQPAVRKLNM